MAGRLSVRSAARSRARTGGRRILEFVEGNRLVEAVTFRILTWRARRAAGDTPLIGAFDEAEHRGSFRTRIAYLRIIRRLANGDITSLPNLVYKIGRDCDEPLMWEAYRLAGFDVDGLSLRSSPRELMDRLHPEIRRELDGYGESMVLEWLFDHGRVELEDERFRALVSHRIDLALRYRLEQSAERLTSAEWEDVGRALAATAAPRNGEPKVFVAGRTLLMARQSSPEAHNRLLELGTFAPLEEVRHNLARRNVTILHECDDRLTISHRATGLHGEIFRFHRAGDLVYQRTPEATRWHRRFDLAESTIFGTPLLVPAEGDQYLDERFGNWTSPTLYRDPLFDAPNTTINETLDAELHLYERASRAFAEGTRFEADLAAEHLRERFGIDYTPYVPQPAHPKVLSRPLRRESNHVPVVMVLGSFATIDAAQIRRLDTIAEGSQVVAAVIDGNDGEERLATVNTLRMVDNVVLCATADELRHHAQSIDADSVVFDRGDDIVPHDVNDPLPRSSTPAVDPGTDNIGVIR